MKTNLTPPLDSDCWYRMVSVDLENGDPFPEDNGTPISSEKVGVAEKWTLTIPNADRIDIIEKAQKLMEGKQWRHNEQAGSEWAGNPVAEALGINLADGKPARTAVKETLEKWIRDGWFRKVPGTKGNRHPTTFVEIAKKAEF